MQAFLDDIRRHSIEYGSIPFWSWNDRLDPAELRRQIGVMQQLGMHGLSLIHIYRAADPNGGIRRQARPKQGRAGAA